MYYFGIFVAVFVAFPDLSGFQGLKLGSAWKSLNMKLFETAPPELDINDNRQSMKLTQSKTVRDIVHPPIMGMPPQPSVEMSSSIVQAVELMVKNDVLMIAVVSGNRLIGHISLTDALESLGIHIPGTPSGRKKKSKER